MLRFWFGALAPAIALVATAGQAQACRIFVPAKLEQAKLADAVVIGRIVNYRVLDRGAKFDVKVRRTLLGAAPKTISVTWINSTFALPEAIPDEEHVIAFQRRPELLGPNPADPLTGLGLMQAHCSEAFLFARSSYQARAVLRLLGYPVKPEPVPPEPRVAAITNPDWVRRPTPGDRARYYPHRAKRQGKEGRAVIRCSVTSKGALANCVVVNEDPAGFGFGEATLRAAAHFKMRPRLPDGRRVEGGVVTIPMVWRLPQR